MVGEQGLISVGGLPRFRPPSWSPTRRRTVGHRPHVAGSPRNDVEFEQLRWVTVGPPGQPEVEILLDTPDTRPPSDRDVMRQLVAKGSLGMLVFATGDCDAAFDKILASGAEVIQEPIDQPYGVRDCAFRDPSGNHLRFSQHLKK